MEILREYSRQDLLEFYLSREREKGREDISLEGVDIDDPNVIDHHFASHGLKIGRIPGYRTWRYAKISKAELLQCAVYVGIFGNQHPQVLSALLESGKLETWKPDRETTWFPTLHNLPSHFVYPEKWALILTHPTNGEAVQCAKWYVEDGSGRAICFLRSLHRNNRQDHAYAYIGEKMDPQSNFMQKKFSDLVSRYS